MYKKIQTTKAREAFIVKALRDKYGQEIYDQLSAVYGKIPMPP
jgi:hypothetical protein